MSEKLGNKYYKAERENQAKHRKSEKQLTENYKKSIEEESRQEGLNRMHPEDSTVESEFAKGGKVGLWANINRRKKLGISRPKSKSTISKKAYANMKAGFPKRKKMQKGGIARGCGAVMSNRRKFTKVY